MSGETIVELRCVKCGSTFRCTTYAVRAGRKYCSGYCSDNRSPAATAARRAASLAWYRRTSSKDSLRNGTS